MELLKQIAKAYNEGRKKNEGRQKAYNVIATTIYTLVTIGAIFNVINLPSFLIMMLVYLYFMYEYRKPDILQITSEGEPIKSIKDLDGKTVTVKLNVKKLEPKIVIE